MVDWKRAFVVRPRSAVGGNSLAAPLVAATNSARRSTAEERRARVDQKSLPQCLASNEHTEAHVTAVGEGGLCGHRLLEELDMQQDYDAVFAMTRGTAHGATIVNFAFDNCSIGVRLLPGHHREAYPVVSVRADKFFNIGRVDGRTVRAGVEFGLNPRNADFGEGDPLAPARDRV